MNETGDTTSVGNVNLEKLGIKIFPWPLVPREPDRIDRILALLKEVWERMPDWRLGQLIVNILPIDWKSSDPFYLEDDKLEEGLRTLLEKFTK